MFLTKWRPFGFSRFDRDFDDLFGALASNGGSAAYSPAVDIVEEEDSFVIRADLPGVDEKEISVKVHEGTLVLAGKREEKSEKKTERGYYCERRSGSFQRTFNLGDKVDAEKIEAKYDKGVLTLTLPKKEETKPRQIEVAVN